MLFQVSWVGSIGFIADIAVYAATYFPAAADVITLILTILLYIAALGGIAVIIGGILIAMDRVGTGKFVIGLGAGVGLADAVAVRLAEARGEYRVPGEGGPRRRGHGDGRMVRAGIPGGPPGPGEEDPPGDTRRRTGRDRGAGLRGGDRRAEGERDHPADCDGEAHEEEKGAGMTGPCGAAADEVR